MWLVTFDREGQLALTRECVYCFKRFSEGADVMKLPCEHVLHKRCCRRHVIGTPQGVRIRCPRCRADIASGLESNSDRDIQESV